MAISNFTPDRIAVDPVEPFGVELNGVALGEYGSEQAAQEFADKLRKALQANTSDGANIDAADLADLRLRQAAGVFVTLGQLGVFVTVEDVHGTTATDALDAVGTLLGQGRDAVRSLNFQRG